MSTQSPRHFTKAPRGQVVLTERMLKMHKDWHNGESMTSIAQKLGISVSAVSQAVRNVEEAWADKRNQEKA